MIDQVQAEWQLRMAETNLGQLDLYPHQQEALEKLGNGKILTGKPGTGKTRVAVAYYWANEAPKDIYVFTTARKRDELDWQEDFALVGVGTEHSLAGKLTVDSWNNIGKYTEVENAFIILDEQRLVGTGVWVKSFLKMAKRNRWIMLSGTPGDHWLDFAPLFIANGYYKNITAFKRDHVVYSSFTKFPKVERYIGVGKLVRLRNELLVDMPYDRHTTRHIHHVKVDYDAQLMEVSLKRRFNPFTNRPMRDSGELFRVMRNISNMSLHRLDKVLDLLKKHPRLIVFYNFDYELETLRTISEMGIKVAEWNGHKHEDVPTGDSWVYLVQYQAGAEAWNCVETNAIAFYSLTYSYKVWEQSFGRIDRLNTPHTDLHYYVLRSDSAIDAAVWKSLQSKKNFNEREFSSKF